MTDAGMRLRDAIEKSYDQFAGMTCPSTWEVSPLRDGDGILKSLTSAPLKTLSGDIIGPYSGWAITTVGNDRDYRHFLPRIFELAVADPAWLGTEPPVLAGKLNMGAWRNWPAGQQLAVVQVFNAAFDAMIERHPDDWPSNVGDWLCGIATLGEPVAPIIERWCSSGNANAALNMGDFISAESKCIHGHGEVRGSFWKEVNVEVRREVVQLLREDRTMAFLLSATDKVSEEDRFRYLDPAVAELSDAL